MFQNNFQVGVDKSFSQNVSDLRLKILLLLLIEKPFICLLWFDFLSVLENCNLFGSIYCNGYVNSRTETHAARW